MCFCLYAGTTKALPRRDWELSSPNLPVKSLTSHDAAIKAHFSNPEVQFIGSTSGCGCAFPRSFNQDGTWFYYSDDQIEPEDAIEHQASRKGLYDVLRSTGDAIVELYGVWEEDFSKAPILRENIAGEKILDPEFRLKEQGFYIVRMTLDD